MESTRYYENPPDQDVARYAYEEFQRIRASIDSIIDGTYTSYTVPASVDVQTGTSTDSVSDMQTLLDGNEYNLNEGSGTPGFDLRIEFTGITSVNGIVMRSYYSGLTSHHAEVALYNYSTTSWDLLIYGDTSAAYNYRTILIPDGVNYYDGSGNAVIRVYHPDSGTPTHDYFIDYVALIGSTINPNVPTSNTDSDAIHDNVAAEISVITEKASPVSADLIIIEDSANSNNKKRVQVGNLPALQADGSVDGTDQLFTGHVGIGATATVGTDEILTLKETVQDDAAAKNAQLFEVLFTGSQLVGQGITSFNGNVTYQATPTVPTGSAVGMFFTATQASTTAMSNLIGARITAASGASTGAITNYVGVDILSTIGATSGAITNSTGVNVSDYGKSVVTTASGIRVAKQTGSTNNYGIMLSGDDLGADITFGAGQDVRMHYDGTNMTLEGSGIAAVGSTATINATIPIDINGTVYHIMLSTTA